MSTTPLALVTLFTSSLMVILSNSWLLLWVCLEINTLAFCSLLTTSNTNNSAEAAINYFIIQSTASAIIVIFLAAPGSIWGINLLFLCGTTAILINLAAAPFHSWFLEVVPNLSVNINIILITWQKLAPIFILSTIINPAITVSILISGFLGSVIQINNTKLLEILALSSVFNLSWMILAAMTSTQSLLIFIASYWTILIMALSTLKKSNINESSNSFTNITSPWTIIVLIAGLAGIPPSLGFYAKIQVAAVSLNSSLAPMITALITISAINFYIYLRTTSPSLIIAPSQRQNNNENSEKLIGAVIVLNFIPLLALTI